MASAHERGCDPAGRAVGPLPPLALPLVPITAVSWTLEALSAGRLPPFKGSMLRGAIGWALDRVAHGAPAPDWPGLSPHAGFVDAVFAPQRAWGDQQACYLWHLQCPDRRQRWARGDRLQGSFILFGTWPDWALDLWRETLDAACQQGFGAQAPRVALARWEVQSIRWLTPPSRPATAVLTLLTPARMQDRGEELHHLHPPAMVRGLLRRVRQLARQGNGIIWEIDYPAWSHHCDALDSTERSCPTVLARWSNRQRRRVEMDGVIGTVCFQAPALADFAPLIAQAPLLHIGRQPNFGYGQCELSWSFPEPL